MLDPEVVNRLRISAEALAEVPQKSSRAREFCDGLAVDIAALLADWERRGEALRQIEREGKSASDVWALRCASVARAALEGASVHDPGRLKEALRRVLTEAGMQAHKHGCPNRLVRPARWDEHRPCAGCEAEAALIDTVVAKEG